MLLENMSLSQPTVNTDHANIIFVCFCFLFCRHSNFGGTYIMTNTKSLSDRELIYHKSIQDVQNFSLDMNKKPRKKPKNRQPITEKPVIRRSTLSIRLSLKEFCVQFLENAYNPLMYAVKVGTCILEKNCDGVLCCSKELYIYYDIYKCLY